MLKERKGTQNLSALIQVLTIAEKTAEATKIPFLKGAIGTALAVADCALVHNRASLGPTLL
jgi:hypothetical protein